MDDLFCYVNGKRVQLPPGRGECTLLEYIRGALLLPRSKYTKTHSVVVSDDSHPYSRE